MYYLINSIDNNSRGCYNYLIRKIRKWSSCI